MKEEFDKDDWADIKRLHEFYIKFCSGPSKIGPISLKKRRRKEIW